MLDLEFELCWQIGFEHPDELEKRLTMPQLCGWIAWMKRRPRGMRHTEAIVALQTAHLRAAWIEGEEDATKFLPQWHDDAPATDADDEFMKFGGRYRV